MKITTKRYFQKEIPLVYLQNSGIGNIVNPVESLTKIYQIPCIFLIGWRGEPGTKDEPQHIKQGELTLPLLDILGIKYFILNKDYEEQIKQCYDYVKQTEKPIALVVKKDTFRLMNMLLCVFLVQTGYED